MNEIGEYEPLLSCLAPAYVVLFWCGDGQVSGIAVSERPFVYCIKGIQNVSEIHSAFRAGVCTCIVI